MQLSVLAPLQVIFASSRLTRAVVQAGKFSTMPSLVPSSASQAARIASDTSARSPSVKALLIDRKSTRPELQSRRDLVCRLLLEKKKNKNEENSNQKKKTKKSERTRNKTRS